MAQPVAVATINSVAWILTLETVMSEAGQLTTYLGTAPGVGKTFAMLAEGRRRAGAGERVVVGWVEHHDRPETRAQLGDLTVVAPQHLTYRGHEMLDLDVAGVLVAQPELAIVDELAHSLPDGTRKRWTDVADILAAGVHVLTSVNIANLVSVRDFAARLTGAGVVESLPDEFVRSGRVVLIDLPPDVLRRRIASGRVYSVDQLGGALAEYFRVANLEALSRLGQAWVAGTTEEIGAALLEQRGLTGEPPRPMVVAGVSESAWGEAVIRRGVDLACDADGELLVVHANIADGTVRSNPSPLGYYQDLTTVMGGTYVEVVGESPSRALAEVARSRGASSVVVASHRGRLGALLRGSVAAQLRRLLPDVRVEEVHERT
jgi:two-component system sensor histidine kinase KdpD